VHSAVSSAPPAINWDLDTDAKVVEGGEAPAIDWSAISLDEPAADGSTDAPAGISWDISVEVQTLLTVVWGFNDAKSLCGISVGRGGGGERRACHPQLGHHVGLCARRADHQYVWRCDRRGYCTPFLFSYG
jgi:hypothetical protein